MTRMFGFIMGEHKCSGKSMRVQQAVVVGILLMATAVLVAGTAVGLGTIVDQDSNDGFGTQISSFAQSSAVDANSTVESGMWEIAVNRSEAPERVVNDRIAQLQKRLERLQNRSEELNDKLASGPDDPILQARASAVRAEILNLQSAINQAENTARRVGVNGTRLNTLRTQAANLSGPEVSAVARNITDAPRIPPSDVPGPPGDGPSGNSTDHHRVRCRADRHPAGQY